MSTRIDDTFARLRSQNHKGFIAYITGGDPDLDRTRIIAHALERAGVDILEIGLPFSDPLADGIANQLSAQRALEAGTNIPKLLAMIAEFRKTSQLPIVIYSYLNPVLTYGFRKFHEEAAAAGVDGLLLLDLPPDEANRSAELANSSGLQRILLIAPTTPAERIAKITAAGSGFIYYVSREGVTGEQSSVATSLPERVEMIRATTKLPIAIGFGVSNPEQAAEVAAAGDAVVVGSAIVKRIQEHAADPELGEKIFQFVQPLVAAAHGV
ncbi:MAG: tryptophan synthase subunit alpha [Chthoniobacterales bacterium]